MDLVTIIFGILVIFVVLFIVIFNTLISAREKVRNSWAQIDVQLKKRADTVMNIVEVVKGYANYEKSTLTELTELRTRLLGSKKKEDALEASNMFAQVAKTLLAVAENYPKLKADKNFLELQKQLVALENDIAYARMVYNDVITMYNTLVLTFPRNVIAPLLQFKQEQYLEATDIEKIPVKVKL